MVGLQDNATGNETHSDGKKKALEKIKCHEMAKSDGTCKTKLSDSSPTLEVREKMAFGKRLEEGKEKSDAINHGSKGVVKVVLENEQVKMDDRKLKAGKVIEVVETETEDEPQHRFQHRCCLDMTGVAKPGVSKTETEDDDKTEIQQPPPQPEDLSSALSKVHISSPPPPRLRSKRGDGQESYNRGRERKRGKPKLGSPEQPKEVPMKNAVMMLNEMFPPPGAAQYKVLSMTGAPNNPTFSIVCCIEGQEFEGSGRSKKEAKLAASQLALSTLFGKVTLPN